VRETSDSCRSSRRPQRRIEGRGYPIGFTRCTLSEKSSRAPCWASVTRNGQRPIRGCGRGARHGGRGRMRMTLASSAEVQRSPTCSRTVVAMGDVRSGTSGCVHEYIRRENPEESRGRQRGAVRDLPSPSRDREPGGFALLSLPASQGRPTVSEVSAVTCHQVCGIRGRR
jgi:hypothetical protein